MVTLRKQNYIFTAAAVSRISRITDTHAVPEMQQVMLPMLTKNSQGNILSFTVVNAGDIAVFAFPGNYGYSIGMMSIYSKDASINSGDLTQTEIHIYGSSRLGVYNLQNNIQY